MRDIGKNIKNLRLREKLTQEELANKLFVTRQTVSNYENGKSRPDVDMIIKIGEVLHADANAVIYGLPADVDRVRDCKKLVVRFVVVVITGAFVILLNRWAEAYRLRTFIFFPYTAVKLFVNPIAFISVGWLLMDTISAFVQFKCLNSPVAKRVRIGIICVVAVILVVMLPNLVFQMIAAYRAAIVGSVNMSFPYIPIFTPVERAVITFTLKYSAVYTFFGILLYILSFPQKRKA